MKRHSPPVTRSVTSRPSRRPKPVKLKPRAVSGAKGPGAALAPIVQAIDRWLTLCVTGKRIPQRVWDDLVAACGDLQAHQVRGTGPQAEMVRAWLGYRAAQMAVQRGMWQRTDVAFHAAYVAWQEWKEHGRHARR